MRWHIHLLATCLLSAICLTPVTAAERLAVGASFSGVFEQSADGQWHGLGVDVLRQLAASAGDTIRFKMYPWPRALAMVEQGQADILIGPYYSPERAKHYAFFELPFYRDRVLFYARYDNAKLWSGELSALRTRRIGTIRGWHYGSEFDRARALLNITEIPQLENGFQMLAYRRVELLASNERNSVPALATLGMTGQLVPLCPAITQLDGYFAFPRAARFAAARDQYSALFKDMIKSGELERLGAENGVLVPPRELAHGRAPQKAPKADLPCSK